MESMYNLPINCDVKTFNEIWCGGLNPACDSHYELGVKSGRKDEENRFFGTHIREVVKTVKDCLKK